MVGVQWAENEASRLFPGEVDRGQNFFHGGPSAKENVQGELSEYHRKAHKEATPFLEELYLGVQKHPRDNPLAAGCAKEIALPAALINIINVKIKKENSKKQKDPDLGIIRYEQMMGLWRTSIADPSMAPFQAQTLILFCEKFAYPSQ